MYSELNKEINSYRYLNFTIQPTYKKYMLVVCHGNVANLRASVLCFFKQSPEPLIYPLSKNFLIVKLVHQEQRRKLINKINKKKLLTVPPRQRCQNLIECKPARRK